MKNIKLNVENPKLVNYTDINIRFSEVDSLGILWHGNVVQYFEDGREDFGQKYNLSYLTIRENGYFAPITKLNINYKNYVKYGTLLEIETTFHFVKSAKIRFSYIIRKKHTGELVCTGESEQVFVNAKSLELIFYKPTFYKNWENTNLLKL